MSKNFRVSGNVLLKGKQELFGNPKIIPAFLFSAWITSVNDGKRVSGLYFQRRKREIMHLDSRGDCFRKIDRLYMEAFA